MIAQVEQVAFHLNEQQSAAIKYLAEALRRWKADPDSMGNHPDCMVISDASHFHELTKGGVTSIVILPDKAIISARPVVRRDIRDQSDTLEYQACVDAIDIAKQALRDRSSPFIMAYMDNGGAGRQIEHEFGAYHPHKPYVKITMTHSREQADKTLHNAVQIVHHLADSIAYRMKHGAEMRHVIKTADMQEAPLHPAPSNRVRSEHAKTERMRPKPVERESTIRARAVRTSAMPTVGDKLAKGEMPEHVNKIARQAFAGLAALEDVDGIVFIASNFDRYTTLSYTRDHVAICHGIAGKEHGDPLLEAVSNTAKAGAKKIAIASRAPLDEAGINRLQLQCPQAVALSLSPHADTNDRWEYHNVGLAYRLARDSKQPFSYSIHASELPEIIRPTISAGSAR